MVLFKFRAWPGGPNLLSAAVYNRAGWRTLFLFALERNALAVRLPLRASDKLDEVAL